MHKHINAKLLCLCCLYVYGFMVHYFSLVQGNMNKCFIVNMNKCLLSQDKELMTVQSQDATDVVNQRVVLGLLTGWGLVYKRTEMSQKQLHPQRSWKLKIWSTSHSLQVSQQVSLVISHWLNWLEPLLSSWTAFCFFLVISTSFCFFPATSLSFAPSDCLISVSSSSLGWDSS